MIVTRIFEWFLIFLLLMITYLMLRNIFVYSFKRKIVSMSEAYDRRKIDAYIFDFDSAFDWFCDQYTYEEMLFSFKPLKLKYWYTEEELTEIYK